MQKGKNPVWSFAVVSFIGLSLLAGLMMFCNINWQSFGIFSIMAFTAFSAHYMIFKFEKSRQEN